MSSLPVQDRDNGVRFSVRVQPRASRSAMDGIHGGALKVRVAAAPVDGAANDELADLLAEAPGVRARAIRIVAGLSARNKIVEVDGINATRVQAHLLQY